MSVLNNLIGRYSKVVEVSDDDIKKLNARLAKPSDGSKLVDRSSMDLGPTPGSLSHVNSKEGKKVDVKFGPLTVNQKGAKVDLIKGSVGGSGWKFGSPVVDTMKSVADLVRPPSAAAATESYTGFKNTTSAGGKFDISAKPVKLSNVKTTFDNKAKPGYIADSLDEKLSSGEERMPFGKPTRSNKPGHKSMVKVKDKNGKPKIVYFGDPTMRIKKNNPERRKSFRARHRCDDPSYAPAHDRTRPAYWSCRAW